MLNKLDAKTSSFPVISHQTNGSLMLRVFFITSISCSESIKRGLNFKLDQVLFFCDSIKVWTDNAAGKDVSKQQ